MFVQRIHDLKLWKRKGIIVFSGIIFVVLAVLVIKMIIPCREYIYHDSYSFETGVSTAQTVIYDGIRLRPGVYLVALEYDTDTDLGALCTVADGTVFTGGLLSNGEHLYSGLGKTNYAVWLYESTENFQVTVSYNGEGSLSTGALTITETNQLWTMLSTIVIFVWLVGSCLIVYYYYDKKYIVSKEIKHTFFFLAVISLIASLPYLNGYNITGADLTYHLQRIEGVKDGLLGGQFPVRIEPRWVYDHGYASAIFYCNTFLYFPAILRLLGFTVSASYNAYCILINIITVWIAYYCFGKMMKDRNIGIACSGLYTMSIFRIYKLVGTTAVGEGSAVAFMPLVAYGLYRIFSENTEEKKYKTSWVPLMLGLAGLIQTHVLSCEITAFVVVVYCLAFIFKVFRPAVFLELAKGGLGAALISLWFLVPFVDYYLTQDVHIKHVSARTIQESGLYVAQLLFHFWTTGSNLTSAGYGMQHSHPIGIGLVLIIALGVFLILWFSGVFRKTHDNRLTFVKVTALLGILLLFMSTNSFPWDRIQSLNPVVASLVSSLQFPNRFLGWGTVCLVIVFGYCLLHFKEHAVHCYWIMTAVAFIGVTTSGMYLSDFIMRDQNYFELYNEESMGFGYISGAEYLIQGTDESLLTFSGPKAGDSVEISRYEKKYLKTKLSCNNRTSVDSSVELPLLLYKGYRAIDVDTGQWLQISAGDNQKVCIRIPANFAGNIQVDFVSPVYWRIAEWISAGTAILLIVAGWRYRRKKPC